MCTIQGAEGQEEIGRAGQGRAHDTGLQAPTPPRSATLPESNRQTGITVLGIPLRGYISETTNVGQLLYCPSHNKAICSLLMANPKGYQPASIPLAGTNEYINTV